MNHLTLFVVLAVAVAVASSAAATIEPAGSHIRRRDKLQFEESKDWRALQEGGARLDPESAAGDIFSTRIDGSSESQYEPVVREPSFVRYVLTFREGASYTAVHFSNFNMGSDHCKMRVSADGSSAHQGYNYDMIGLGKMNSGTFWAQHVVGDTIILEISCENGALVENTAYEIDQYSVGYRPSPIESVCGAADFENAVCYGGGGDVRYERAKAVARLLIHKDDGNSYWCTGWLIGPNCLITNEHCITDQFEATNTDYEFGAEAPFCASPNSGGDHPGMAVYSGATFLRDSVPLDYAIVQFAEDQSPHTLFPILEIDNREGILDEQIYIPQHPGGRAKEFGVVSTHLQNPSGFCQLDSLFETGCTGGPFDYGYYCDTQGGSSGSPVLAQSSHKVIALHHCRGRSPCTSTGDDENRGVPIHLIVDEIADILAKNVAMMGDPHIKTWGGQWFDYMGMCDLVFLHAPNFDGQGRDFTIHARTTILHDYSYIESAAIQIGSDVLEVASFGDAALNGVDTPDLQKDGEQSLAGYKIWHTQVNKKHHTFTVELSPKENVTLTTHKHLVAVNINHAGIGIGIGSANHFENSVGMIGSYKGGTLLARDGMTVMEDLNAFGQEWQVTAEEPMLFRTARDPQYPSRCLLPPPKTAAQRRLGENLSQDTAEDACAHLSGAEFENCVYDVMATGDVDTANTY